MALKELTLDTIKDLDFGKAAVGFKVALERAVKDCNDRPSDDRKRTVVLSLTLVPVKEISGNTISCEGAKGVFQVRCKIPDWEMDTVDFGVKNNGMLYFSEESPKNHRQGTMAFEDESA